MSNTVDRTGGGGGGGKVVVQDLSFIKRLDKATPKLMESCTKGTSIPIITLAVTKSADEPLDYLVITMRDVIVTSVSISGGAGDERPTESVSLNFGHIHMAYTPQNPDGSLGETVEFMYNVATNETQ